MMVASLRYYGSRVTVDERTELLPVGSFREHFNRNYAVHPSSQEFAIAGDTDTRIVWRVNALAGER